MNEKRSRTPLVVRVNEAEKTLFVPIIKNPNDLSWGKLHQDVERIQFYSIGHGGKEVGEEYQFVFEQEEFNCVLRYLLKFEWKRTEVVIT